nr:MAG TPA: hypothetical protein [Caudoviricetes sp.]
MRKANLRQRTFAPGRAGSLVLLINDWRLY